MRREGLLPISPSCRSFCAKTEAQPQKSRRGSASFPSRATKPPKAEPARQPRRCRVVRVRGHGAVLGDEGKAVGCAGGFAVSPQMTTRRFPPPWIVVDIGAAFVVRDHNGQSLAYVYFEDEPGRRSAAKLLTRDYGGLSVSSLSAVTARRFPPPWSVTEPPASKRVSR
jgi:hypothetical protein